MSRQTNKDASHLNENNTNNNDKNRNKKQKNMYKNCEIIQKKKNLKDYQKIKKHEEEERFGETHLSLRRFVRTWKNIFSFVKMR